MASRRQENLRIRSKVDIKNNRAPEKIQFSTPASLFMPGLYLEEEP